MNNEVQNENQTKSRNYDKNPIKIINYSVLFESHLIILIGLIGIPLLINDVYKIILENGSFTLRLGSTALVWIYFIYLIFIDYPKKFKEKPSYFLFNQNEVKYHFKYLQKKKDDLILASSVNQISQISFSIINELPNSYGRWHYLSSWQLYRKSSIGVHIGKATLFIRYVITYLFFILPYKLWRLYRAGEPFTLLSKNFFIQFTNRNYLLVNIYSQKDLDELLEYFQIHNIPVNQKTYFIPHLQNQGWFVDKEEIWTNELKNQQGEK